MGIYAHARKCGWGRMQPSASMPMADPGHTGPHGAVAGSRGHGYGRHRDPGRVNLADDGARRHPRSGGVTHRQTPVDGPGRLPEHRHRHVLPAPGRAQRRRPCSLLPLPVPGTVPRVRTGRADDHRRLGRHDRQGAPGHAGARGSGRDPTRDGGRLLTGAEAPSAALPELSAGPRRSQPAGAGIPVGVMVGEWITSLRVVSLRACASGLPVASSRNPWRPGSLEHTPIGWVSPSDQQPRGAWPDSSTDPPADERRRGWWRTGVTSRPVRLQGRSNSSGSGGAAVRTSSVNHL